MGLPLTLNPATPAGSDSPVTGDDEFRALKDYLISGFGAPNNVALTAAAFTLLATGQVTVAQTPFTVPSMLQGPASNPLVLNSQYTGIELRIATQRIGGFGASGMMLSARYIQSSSPLPMIIGNITNATVILQNNSIDRVSIDSGGNVGILGGGMNMFTGNLTVGLGNIVSNSGNLQLLSQNIIGISGRLGVGTLTPTQFLHIAGWSFFASRMDIGGHIRVDAHVSGRLVLPVGTGLYAS